MPDAMGDCIKNGRGDTLLIYHFLVVVSSHELQVLTDTEYRKLPLL
jgi:hypothetical protein